MTMMRHSPGSALIVCQTLIFVTTKLGCVEGFTSIAVILPEARSLFPVVGSQRQSTTTTDDWESSSSYGTPSVWSIGDDWSNLSSESPENAVPDSRTLINQDLSRTAAREMAAAAAAAALDAKVEKSEEDVWLTDVIDEIHNEFSTMDASTKLYDTGFESYTKTVNYLDEMGKEIAMLVRCNQSPEELLVEQGRALPPLSQSEKNHVSQLVEVTTHDNGDLIFQPTNFLKESISTIFQQHATRAESDDNKKNEDDSEKESNLGPLRMDRGAIANWMTQCLRTEKDFKRVSSHDKRVVQTIAHHATYGTGYLTEPEFLQFYLNTIVGDTQPAAESKSSRDALFRHFQYRQDLVDAVFRDVRNHGILPPLEQERAKKAHELRQTYGSATAQESQAKADQFTSMDGVESLLDECEILDWDHRVEQSQTISTGKSERGQAMGSKSSHKILEMASDGKTPLFVRDGKHVFIDEESCIGCMQCVNVSPNSFLMLESGRARTFNQRSATDVDQAVASCPVNCMHPVSFRELKEFESARDDGDGRTDHRHLGHDRGMTPLHVARIGSDNNHRSSWYHTLKHRCLMSSECPKKGCYNCPMYSKPGANPYFQQQHQQAEHARAVHFEKTGDSTPWRKTAEL